MALGVGIDIVMNERFSPWAESPEVRLSKLFSQDEIAIFRARSNEPLPARAHYLASRFAAKEAFYKALCTALVRLGLTSTDITFAQVRPHVYTREGRFGTPSLVVDWIAIEKLLGKKLPVILSTCSLSHDGPISIGLVVLDLA